MKFINRTCVELNIDSLVKYGLEHLKIAPSFSKKKNLLSTLNTIQRVQFEFTERPTLTFSHPELQAGFVRTKVVTEQQAYGEEFLVQNLKEQDNYQKNFEDALTLLKNTSIDLYQMIESLINTIFLCKVAHAGGGSTTSYISLIWLSPKSDWTTTTWAENIFHEFTHNSIFLDDMINVIFPNYDELFKEDAMVTSSILKRKRPFDKAYHSAAVSIALMFFYELVGNSKKSMSFFEPLKRTVGELCEVDAYLSNKGREVITEHGRASLRDMVRFTDTPYYEEMLRALSYNLPKALSLSGSASSAL